MEIKVTIRQVYGIERIYPACDKSKTLADFANVKTFSRNQIEHLKSLGHTVAVDSPLTL